MNSVCVCGFQRPLLLLLRMPLMHTLSLVLIYTQKVPRPCADHAAILRVCLPPLASTKYSHSTTSTSSVLRLYSTHSIFYVYGSLQLKRRRTMMKTQRHLHWHLLTTLRQSAARWISRRWTP